MKEFKKKKKEVERDTYCDGDDDDGDDDDDCSFSFIDVSNIPDWRELSLENFKTLWESKSLVFIHLEGIALEDLSIIYLISYKLFFSPLKVFFFFFFFYYFNPVQDRIFYLIFSKKFF